MHGPGLAALRDGRGEGGQQAGFDWAVGGQPRLDQSPRDIRRGQQVAGRGGAIDGVLADHAERVAAGVDGRPSRGVKRDELAELGEGFAGDHGGDRRRRVGTVAEQGDQLGAEPWIGNVLRQHRSGAVGQMHATGRHGRGRGADHRTERSAGGVAGDHREGHVPVSAGRTAVASISTSHSGRARAETTRPVETG